MRRAGLLLLVGCNQIYGLDPTQIRDPDDLEPPACANVQFGAPQPLPQFDRGDREYDPQLSADGLELWYTSNTIGTNMRFLLFRGTRASTDAPFETELVNLVSSSSSHQGEPALTADGRRMMFKVEGSPPLLYEGIRNDSHQFPFDTVVEVAGFGQILPSEVDGFDLTWDGLRLYYVTSGKLWLARRENRNAAFLEHRDLGIGNVDFPTLSGDELEIFYTHFDMPADDRPMYRRERPDVDSPFGPEALVLDNAVDPDIAPTSSQMIVARDAGLYLLTRRCDEN